MRSARQGCRSDPGTLVAVVTVAGEARAPALFRPLGARDRVTSVARRLEDAIAAGLLPPGSRLPPEELLAGTLDVSLTTLRAALHELRTMGTITTHRGRQGGSVVTVEEAWLLDQSRRRLARLRPTELRDTGDLHAAIFAEAARLAAERTTAAERAALKTSTASLEAGDLRAELELHLEIASLSQSARLLGAELDYLLSIGGLLRLRDSTACHGHCLSLESVATSILAAQPARAYEAARQHAHALTRWLIEQVVASASTSG